MFSRLPFRLRRHGVEIEEILSRLQQRFFRLDGLRGKKPGIVSRR